MPLSSIDEHLGTTRCFRVHGSIVRLIATRGAGAGITDGVVSVLTCNMHAAGVVLARCSMVIGSASSAPAMKAIVICAYDIEANSNLTCTLT